MAEIEIERTYLLKRIPTGLADCRHKEVLDVYIPGSAAHPQIRLRKSVDRLELTKKSAPGGADFSQQVEETILLTRAEYDEFLKLGGKEVRKVRYYYAYRGKQAEIDVFKDGLEGLVVADFEFGNEREEKAFAIPDFCLAEVTQEEFVAGGMLCGKSYADIEKDLARFGYARIYLKG